jgi:hypothetical protein
LSLLLFLDLFFDGLLLLLSTGSCALILVVPFVVIITGVILLELLTLEVVIVDVAAWAAAGLPLVRQRRL